MTKVLEQPIQLPFTTPSFESMVSYSAGVRAYREGGVRMQKEQFFKKTIYHNYGYGGGGITLAYGCSNHLIQTQFLPTNISPNQTIAVFGAGIVGLTTAYLLVQNGFNVNLYAELVPFEKVPNQPEITTTVAAGYWMPLKIGNKEDSYKFAVESWKHYSHIKKIQEQSGKQLGVSLLKTYCINDDENLTFMPIKDIIVPQKCTVTFGDQVLHPAFMFSTYVIETQNYLPYLLSCLHQSQKFKLFREKLNSLEDLNKKNQNQIFNCMGGPTFFKDPNLNKGIKGHVIKFNLQKNIQVKDFIVFMKTAEKRWILQVPQPQTNQLVLGISYQEGKTDPLPDKTEIKKIWQTMFNFYQSVSLKKKKISAKL